MMSCKLALDYSISSSARLLISCERLSIKPVESGSNPFWMFMYAYVISLSSDRYS